MILREWYQTVQGTLRNHISDVTKKNLDSLLITTIFQNGCLKILDFQYLGNYFTDDHDLGSKPIFSLSMNQINTLYNIADLYYVYERTKNMKKSKMAANFTLHFGKCVITFVQVAIKR